VFRFAALEAVILNIQNLPLTFSGDMESSQSWAGSHALDACLFFSCSVRNSADAGNPAQQTHRYGTTYTLGRTTMPTKSEICTLSLQEIDLVAGGTSLSPEQLARGRATIKGTDGSSPEESASFLGKFIRGLIKL
jgi:hypothetical protein